MKTERKGYQKAVLVIAVFTILAGALYATDNFRKIPQNKSGSSILKRNEHGQGEKNQKLVAKTKDQKAKITVEIQEQSYTQETFSTSVQLGLKLKFTDRNGGIYDCSDSQRREVQRNAGRISAKTSGVYRTRNPMF